MRIDHLFFGYRILFVKEEERAFAANALLKRGLNAEMDSDGKIHVVSYKAQRYKKVLSSSLNSISDIKGLPSLILEYRKRYGVIVGIMLSIVYILFASMFVWDIRVEENSDISGSLVEKELSKSGFETGSFWNKKNISKIETSVLENSENIGWININKRGSVAYVSAREKKIHEQTKNEKDGYSNVVATVDCIIEEITVRSGVACVKKGDTVRAGELLISGVLPQELGGGFVRADGDVFGVVSEQIAVSVAKTEQSEAYGEEKVEEVSVKFLKFSIKLFKNYGKSLSDCVIIDDVKEFVLFGKYRLPFSVQKIYSLASFEKTVTHTEKEMTELALKRLEIIRNYKFSDCDILKLKTSGRFLNDTYVLTNDVTVLKSIGEEKYFSEPGE